LSESQNARTDPQIATTVVPRPAAHHLLNEVAPASMTAMLKGVPVIAGPGPLALSVSSPRRPISRRSVRVGSTRSPPPTAVVGIVLVSAMSPPSPGCGTLERAPRQGQHD